MLVFQFAPQKNIVQWSHKRDGHGRSRSPIQELTDTNIAQQTPTLPNRRQHSVLLDKWVSIEVTTPPQLHVVVLLMKLSMIWLP